MQLREMVSSATSLTGPYCLRHIRLRPLQPAKLSLWCTVLRCCRHSRTVLSAAPPFLQPAVECSHSAEPNPAAPAHSRPSRGRLPRPSNSLISTAVQPTSPHGHLHQQPVSPKLNRANSVVSHTAPGGRPHGRAGTPASVYGQGFLLPGRARQLSPARQLAAEQVGG